MKLNSWLRLVFVSLISWTLACGGSDDVGDASAAGTENPMAEGTSATPDSRSPEDVAQAFMDAGNAGDQEAFLELLTPAARKGLGGDGEGFSLEPDQFQDIEIGDATIEGDDAKVPVSASQNGAAQEMTLRLRQVAKSWRVYGMDVQAGEMSMSMNFEELGQMVEQMAESMGSAMKETFESSMNDWQAGGSAEEIARERAAFNAMKAISEEAYRAEWMNDESFSDATVGDALQTIAKRLGLEIAAGDFEEKLKAPVDSDLAGVSNLEAIERLGRQIGAYPEYPDLQGGAGALGEAFVSALAEGIGQVFNGESGALKIDGTPEDIMEAMQTDGDSPSQAPAVTLIKGERPYPAEFAGPFMIDVYQVDEVPPHGTGTLTVRVTTFGINPTILDLLANDSYATTFGRIVDAKDRSLVDEDVHYMSGGEVVGAAYIDLFPMEMRNLLRDVTAIDKVPGVQKVTLPLEIQDVTLEKIKEGEIRTVDGLTFEIKQAGENTSIDIKGSEELLEGLQVRMAADNAAGEPLGILYQDSMAWMPTQVQASLNTPEKPTTIHLKLITKSALLEYPFELGPIPLESYAQMPEKLIELDYGNAAAPLSAEFVRHVKADPNFPEIEVRLVNHSNKDVTSYFADFIYEDASGNKIDNMPTTLTGEYSFEGSQPLAKAGETKLQTTTAFSMPEGTKSITIQPIHVEFVDGSRWEAER